MLSRPLPPASPPDLGIVVGNMNGDHLVGSKYSRLRQGLVHSRLVLALSGVLILLGSGGYIAWHTLSYLSTAPTIISANNKRITLHRNTTSEQSASKKSNGAKPIVPISTNTHSPNSQSSPSASAKGTSPSPTYSSPTISSASSGSTSSGNSGCVGVNIPAGGDIEAAINGNPSGTSFCLQASIYHPSSLTPKTGDSFDGDNRSALLDGQGTIAYAFNSSSANNVTIKNMVIQNYNNPTQSGAIQSFGTSGWQILNNDINHNNGAGITVDNGAQVINNHLWYNHQEGYACHGNNDLFQGNEIDHNNWLMQNNPSWEAGGGKCWATQYTTFKDNYVHDNGGPGLWTDTDNVYTTYDHNMLSNNWGAGIFHEISYSATITNNIATGNGYGEQCGWVCDGGIELSSSGGQDTAHPIIISGNTVSNNWNGIGMMQQNRGSGSLGTYLLQNIQVYGNTVTMSRGLTGVVEDDSDTGVWTRNISFSNNTYHVNSLSSSWFAWRDSSLNWQAWQGDGMDTNGSLVSP